MTDKKTALAAIAGLTFADCIKFFASQPMSEKSARCIEAARDQWHQDGEIEIDDITVASGSDSDGGDYVLGWLWVEDPAPDAGDVEEDADAQ